MRTFKEKLFAVRVGQILLHCWNCNKVTKQMVTQEELNVVKKTLCTQCHKESQPRKLNVARVKL